MAAKKDFNLVIVESPAKAKTVGKFLGKDYKVQASNGHVIDLPKSQLGVNIEENFEPKYITIRGKGDVLKRLRKEVKKSKNVYLATDPDREGEAISWHLARALKLDEENNRIAFNEITREAVQQAIDDCRSIDENLVNAQQARRILDRLVGYKLSPLLWKKVRKGLSAGRVQTVAVKIICEREKEIEAFEPDEYWSLDAVLKKDEQDMEAELHHINGEEFNIPGEEEMQEIIDELQERQFEVSKINERKRKRNPYPPFTTSTLQQRASSKLNFSAKKTMFIAQQLYEGIEVGSEGSVGLISYMRTDSTRVSREAQNEALAYIKDEFGKKYAPQKARNYQASDESQDAHEAVRPTSVNRVPEKIKKHLTSDQFRLYKLIWTQFVASQMKSAVYKLITVDVEAGEKYLFRISGSEILFPGFIRLTGTRKDDVILPDLDEGDQLEVEEFIPEQHFTKPPPRYTEARLVKTLEEKGIGRPSTYAPTISTIISREYVERDNKNLVPTELGFIVTDLLTEFFPQVTDEEFTAYLEERLDSIEEGKDNWKEVLSDFYFSFADRLEVAEEEMEEVDFVEETDEVCEKCGSPMVVKHGRYGKFLACSAYPECENTRPYLEKIGVKCPECEDGDIIKRKSKKGRRFFGCSNYPDCEFVAWDKPVAEKCPECGGLMVEKSSKSKGTYHKCINKECLAEHVITNK